MIPPTLQDNDSIAVVQKSRTKSKFYWGLVSEMLWTVAESEWKYGYVPKDWSRKIAFVTCESNIGYCEVVAGGIIHTRTIKIVYNAYTDAIVSMYPWTPKH